MAILLVPFAFDSASGLVDPIGEYAGYFLLDTDENYITMDISGDGTDLKIITDNKIHTYYLPDLNYNVKAVPTSSIDLSTTLKNIISYDMDMSGELFTIINANTLERYMLNVANFDLSDYDLFSSTNLKVIGHKNIIDIQHLGGSSYFNHYVILSSDGHVQNMSIDDENLSGYISMTFEDIFYLPDGINPSFFEFSSDGLYMFIFDNDTSMIHGFSLSIPYGVTSSEYLGEYLLVYGQVGKIGSINFINDGMSLYVLGINEGEIIHYNLHTPYLLDLFSLYSESVTDTLDSEKKSSGGGGCNDCTPPTLGLDKNMKRIVDYGFSYNDNITQVEYWHTPFPLINATVGDTNLVEIIVYENGGINNMERVQFGLGAEGIGQTLSTLEVLVDVELETFGTLEDIAVKEITITDKNNLIDNDTVSASTYVVKCQNDSLEDHCVKIDLQYSYREATFNHIMVVNAADKNHNSQNFWFNDGVQVIGESINEPPTFIMQNKHSNQQTDDIFLTLTLVDKFTETWVDKYGIEYLQVLENNYSRITPLEKETCDNTPWSILNNPDRRSCQFKMLFEYELDRVTKLANEYYN